jgi:hypothetical protein
VIAIAKGQSSGATPRARSGRSVGRAARGGYVKTNGATARRITPAVP